MNDYITARITASLRDESYLTVGMTASLILAWTLRCWDFLSDLGPSMGRGTGREPVLRKGRAVLQKDFIATGRAASLRYGSFIAEGGITARKAA